MVASYKIIDNTSVFFFFYVYMKGQIMNKLERRIDLLQLINDVQMKAPERMWIL